MGVEFDNDQMGMMQKMQALSNQGKSSSKFANWLIAKGIAKTETGAQVVLIGIVVINIAITVFVIRLIL